MAYLHRGNDYSPTGNTNSEPDYNIDQGKQYSDPTFDYYQDATDSTAIYPQASTGSTDAINYCVLGLSGEAGELPNKWKKVFRDDNGVLTDERREAMLDELGDVLWYVARLANELGVHFSEVATNNLTRLYDRKDRGVLTGSGDNR